MNRILIVGCGDIAMRVAPILNTRHHLFGLVRRREHFAKLRVAGITPLLGDLDERESLVRVAGLAEVVMHFAPPPAQTLPRNSAAEKGSQKKGAPVDFRTRNLLAALTRGKLPKYFVYISTTGVYGDCGGAYVSETHPINPLTARGYLRVNAEMQIRNWAKRNGVKACILRVPGIYAADRLPLERLRSGSPAIMREEDSYTNHINADDLAQIVVNALKYAKPNRIYNTCDDSEMKMGDYFDEVADAFKLSYPARLPREEVKRIVSPMLWSFMGESRRITNDRMKQELKVKLRYPSVSATLEKINRRC